MENSFDNNTMRLMADKLPARIAHIALLGQGLIVRYGNAMFLSGVAIRDTLELVDVLGEAKLQELEPMIQRVLTGEPVEFDERGLTMGMEVWLRTTLQPDYDAAGGVCGFVLMSVDITRQKQVEESLQASEARLRVITNHLPALVIHIDRQERVQFVNAACEAWFIDDVTHPIDQAMRSVFVPALYDQSWHQFHRGLDGETVHGVVELPRATGSCFYSAIYTPQFDVDRKIIGVYGVMHDITDLKHIELELTQLAKHDALTGLVNRSKLNEVLRDALSRRRRLGSSLAVLFLDVDHFKRINDSLGHAVGDEVLIEFAARLKTCVRETDTVSRLGGDEFVLVLENMSSPDDASIVAEKILVAIGKSFSLTCGIHTISTSIGIAIAEDGDEPARLLNRADEALYISKAAGRGKYSVTP